MRIPELMLQNMTRNWRTVLPGLVYPVSLIACLSFAAPHNATAAEVRNSGLNGQVNTGPRAAASISTLLVKLELQIAADDRAVQSNDNPAETIADLLLLVPGASPSEARLLAATPAHLAQRSSEAAANGHSDEAARFAAMSDILRGILDSRAANNTSDFPAPPVTESSDTSAATRARSIAELLEKLEQHVTQAREATLDESDMIADILLSLPEAPPSEAKLAWSTPAHFRQRALEAEAAGRGEEAARFATLADAFANLLNGRTPNDPVDPLRSPPGTGVSKVAPAGEFLEPAGVPAAAMTDNLGLPPKPAVGRPRPAMPLSALLSELEQQLTDAPRTTIDESDLIADILLRLPNATRSEAELVSAIPAHFADRAREAKAAGRDNEAGRFVMLADVLQGLIPGNTQYDAGAQQKPQPARPAPPVVATKDNPAEAEPPEAASAPIIEASGAEARPQRPGSVTSLLTKLEQKIAETDQATLDESDTIADILLSMPNAPPADAKLILATPSRLIERARMARAAGRNGEASRFGAVADVFASLMENPSDGATAPSPPARSDPGAASATGSHDLANAATPAPGDRARLTSPWNGDAPARTAVSPEPAAAIPAPAGSRTLPPMDLTASIVAPGSTAKASRAPDRLQVARLTGGDVGSSMASTPVKPGPGARAQPSPGASPALVAPRLASPTPTNSTTTSSVDPQCRAIQLKFGLGEEPTDAERSYLRRGCRPRG